MFLLIIFAARSIYFPRLPPKSDNSLIFARFRKHSRLRADSAPQVNRMYNAFRS